MKKIKQLAMAFLSLMLVFGACVTTYALDYTKEDGLTTVSGDYDGVTITTRTDKTGYSNGDVITYYVDVYNGSTTDLADVTVTYTLNAENGEASLETSSATIDSLAAGETKTLTVKTTSISAEGAGLSTGLLIGLVAGGVCAIVVVVVIIVVISKKKNKKDRNDNDKNDKNGKIKETIVTSALILTLVAPLLTMCPTITVSADDVNGVSNSDYNKVSVHDPSIVKDPETGTYYIFGSHRAWAKTTDLMNWKTFTNNISSDYEELFGEVWSCYCKTDTNSSVAGNCWAPDVIWNEEMGKWCMYMSINGDDWHSAIVLLTADSLDGDWEYVDEVIFSGFDGTAGGKSALNVTAYKKVAVGDSSFNLNIRMTLKGDAVTRFEYSDLGQVLGIDSAADIPSRYNSTDYCKVNAIDPSVFYDEDGNLWMTYGSWSAGIYMIKLDGSTGLRDYDTTYDYVLNTSDPYLGYKIAGGYYNSGEGSYIEQIGDYYYLFITYGNLEYDGGYNMRVYRSEDVTGPYVDMNGTSAILTSWETTIGYSTAANKYTTLKGLKLFGMYNSASFYGIGTSQVAQGHNSVLVDDDGSIYLFNHVRGQSSNGHQVYVHQLYVNEDGWLVAGVYEYSGETLADSYTMSEVAGTYEFVYHDPTLNWNGTSGMVSNVLITLSSDGKVTCADNASYSGTWSLDGSAITLTLSSGVYKGYVIEQANELATRDQTMTFTVAGENVTFWGIKNPSNN